MAPKLDPWIRVFDVSDPVTHQKGFTVYKVTSRVFPRNSPEAVTEVIVWKRYSDFKKLHKVLQTLHAKLYLKGTFPAFAKARVFGRFDGVVIEERQQSALKLLEFAAQHPPLFTSQVFVKFFEESQKRPNGVDTNLLTEKCVLKSVDIKKDSSSLQENSSNNADNVTVIPFRGESPSSCFVLGGVWQHPQGHDSISVSSDNSDEAATDTDSLLNTSVSTSDLSVFDPFAISSSSDVAVNLTAQEQNVSNSWLLSSLVMNDLDANHCSETQTPQVGPEPTSAKGSDANDSIVCQRARASSLCTENACDGTERETFTSNWNVSANVDTRGTESEVVANNDLGIASSNFASVPKPRQEASKSKVEAKGSPSFFSPLSFAVNDRSGEYLCEAASHISLAQQNEANGSFEAAFSFYKAGVATLLKGVQTDTNNSRRDAVRKKTAQYLMRAEDIYKNHLAALIEDENRWGTNSRLSPTVDRDRSVSLLQAPLVDLKSYRVLGVIDRVQLVLDTTTNKTFVLKVLRKSSTIHLAGVPSIVPSKIPCMVQLYKFIENEDAIFLIIQHAAGGKLWNYIKSYLQNSPQSPYYEPDDCDHLVMHTGQIPTNEGNVYSGKKLLCTDEDKKNGNGNGDVAVPTGTSKTSSADSKVLDLLADPECPVSYSQLFTNYAASLEPDKIVGLAKCSIAHVEEPETSAKPMDSIDENDCSERDAVEGVSQLSVGQSNCKCSLPMNLNSLRTTDDNELRKTDAPDPPSPNGIEDDNVDETNLCDLNSIKNFKDLEHIDAQDLIHCAQKLLKTVDQTLQGNYVERNNKIITVANSGDDGLKFEIDNLADKVPVTYANSIERDVVGDAKTFGLGRASADSMLHQDDNASTHKPRQNSFDAALPEKHRNQRKFSEDSVFASPCHEVRLSSSADSLLESSKPRLRHLSMVFQQLDELAGSNCCLPESCIRVWGAEMVVAISRLHNLGIICRDLRPDNILLGERGHILLSYFSHWGYVEKPVNLDALESLYSAPEVNGFSPVTPSCDWWSLGALLFELLTSKTLASSHPGGINSHTALNLPTHVSAEAQSLLKQLLTFHVNERLGSGPEGVDAIKAHPFFHGVNWYHISAHN